MPTSNIPASGFLRLKHILGDKKAKTPPIIPICRSTWFLGVKSGRYPQPVKIGARAVAWRAKDIRCVAALGYFDAILCDAEPEVLEALGRRAPAEFVGATDICRQAIPSA